MASYTESGGGVVASPILVNPPAALLGVSSAKRLRIRRRQFVFSPCLGWRSLGRRTYEVKCYGRRDGGNSLAGSASR